MSPQTMLPKSACKLTLIVIVLMPLLFSQAQPDLKFEVASIRASDADARNVNTQLLPGGGLRVVNGRLRQLIAMAYDVQNDQISGGPDWINSKGFDITAKAPSSEGNLQPGPEMQKQVGARLQDLLAERFKLVIKRESKETPVYALVLTKNGHKMSESSAQRRGVNASRSGFVGSGVDMNLLASVVSRRLGRPVIDRTGLKGTYDFKLEWAPDVPLPLGREPGREGAPRADASGPSIFTALQEQLGLKLEAQKAPVDHIVIVSVSEPTEN